MSTENPSIKKTKPKLVISFDVEATSRSPHSGSCNMIGMVGVLENTVPTKVVPTTGTPEQPGWVLFKKQWCLTEYNGRSLTCMTEFWDHHKDVLFHIQKNARQPDVVMNEISDLLTKLDEEYEWYFMADPASFDWQWLNTLYDRYGRKNKFPIGYKAICMDGMEKAILAMGFPIPDTRPTEGYEHLKMSHFADDDAEYQAYQYLILRKFLREMGDKLRKTGSHSANEN